MKFFVKLIKTSFKIRESFRHKPEELYWNLKRNHFYWDDLKKEWEQILRTNPEDFTAISIILGKVDVLISETMMHSEVEQTKKDQNSLRQRCRANWACPD